jgi:type VI secretion system protein ImpB
MSIAQDQTVAPQERVNITYKPATGDQQAEEELPFKGLVLGDFTGSEDARPVEERKPVDINADNFQQVLAEHNVGVDIKVSNPLEEKGAELSVQLKFKKLSDFTPDAVAAQIDPLKELLALRAELTALKGPMGNVPAFRKKIDALVKDKGKRAELMKALGVKEEG